MREVDTAGLSLEDGRLVLFTEHVRGIDKRDVCQTNSHGQRSGAEVLTSAHDSIVGWFETDVFRKVDDRIGLQ